MAEGSSNNPAHLSGMLCSGCCRDWPAERGASYDGFGEGSVTRGCWRRHAPAEAQARYNMQSAACSMQGKEHATVHLDLNCTACTHTMPCPEALGRYCSRMQPCMDHEAWCLCAASTPTKCPHTNCRIILTVRSWVA